MRTYALISLAVLMIGSVAMADLTVNSGDIKTVDPTRTVYGAVRFKDFTNTKDGGDAGNLYLQDGSGLGNGTGRVQASPHWVAGTSHSFSFEYRPVDGATDLILAQAANMATPAQRLIDDPAKPVNFISFWIHNTPLADVVTPDTIALTLTDLDGNKLSPSSLFVGPPGGDYNWYLTNPTLLANGFILSGSVNLTSGLDAGEADKIDIAFGNTAVPAPGAALLAGIGLGLVGWVKRRFA